MGRAPTYREQLDRLKKTLAELQLGPTSEFLTTVADTLSNWPGHIDEGEMVELAKLISTCFKIPVDDAEKMIRIAPVTAVKHRDLAEIVPSDGWLGTYLQETLPSESPTIFHLMNALVGLGAFADRRFWISQGHFKIFTNLNVLLIAPTGICRKTASINIMADVLTLAGYEKFILGSTTPEAFVLDIGANDPASCLILGHEMAAFFRKAKYMEGMIPLLTDLIDSRDEWKSLTIGRGKLVLKHLMLSGIYGTTMDWLNTNLPPDVFGGGFMRRHLIAYQERRTRLTPRPPDMDAGKKRLADDLRLLTVGSQQFHLDGAAGDWYDNWYVRSEGADQHRGEERMAGYLESKPVQVLRLAMLLQLSSQQRALTVESLERSLALLEWLEQFLPKAFSSMATTAVGENEDRIVRYLKNAAGKMSHSDLVRRMSKYVTASKLSELVNTLKEAELLEERPKTVNDPRSYYLTRKARGAE